MKSRDDWILLFHDDNCGWTIISNFFFGMKKKTEKRNIEIYS